MPHRAPGTLMTAEELFEMPDDGVHYELSRGRLLCMPPAGPISSIVAAKVVVRVARFVDERGLGVYGVSEGGFKLGAAPDIVRAPDVWFVRADRVPPGPPRGFWEIAPDLAIEALSPSDRISQVMLKVREYLDAGVRLVWIIDPEARTALVFRPDQRERIIDEDGVLDGADVLPGFTLRLSEVLP
jgi:Uma2 family endonuclease